MIRSESHSEGEEQQQQEQREGHARETMAASSPASKEASGSAPDQLERCISTNTTGTLGPPPDGGVLAWVQVVGAFFLFVNSWGIANTYGVYQTYYEQTRFSQQSSEQIAWIGSLQSFLLLIVSALAGPLFDKGSVCLQRHQAGVPVSTHALPTCMACAR